MSNASKNDAVPICAVDPYGREVKSLRLSVTQKCDLSCTHCHREGQSFASEEMTVEEIERLVRVGTSIGIRKVKITGGEPLLREDIIDIVKAVSPLVSEVSMTTNGTRLARLAKRLKDAGLARVNVSLHSIEPSTYTRLCGRNAVRDVVAGIQAAVESGLSPVKVNMVVFKGINEHEMDAMMEFCGRTGAVLQLIEYMSDREGENGCQFRQRHLSLDPVERILSRRSLETSVNELHRRRRYVLPLNGFKVQVEVVRPMHNTEFCANCTRIRISSDGKLKPCLLDKNGEVDVLRALRGGAPDDEIRALYLQAVRNRRPYWS